MICKLCGEELEKAFRGYYCCVKDGHKSYVKYDRDGLHNEEYLVAEKYPSNNWNVISIYPFDREIQMQIICGSRVITNKLLKNTVIDLSEIKSEEDFINKFNKLMLLF